MLNNETSVLESFFHIFNIEDMYFYFFWDNTKK
jgi:hypothetical protein